MLYDLKTFFPQKKRIFSAKVLWTTLILAGITAGILRLFSSATFGPPALRPPPTKFDQLTQALLKNPRDPSLHQKLAQVYQAANDLEGAGRELTLALKYNKNPSEINHSLANLREAKSEPEKIEAQIGYWHKILEKAPGYRDGYFQIAVLNYQIYKDREALEAVNKALEVDPNFEPAKKLKRLLSP